MNDAAKLSLTDMAKDVGLQIIRYQNQQIILTTRQ